MRLVCATGIVWLVVGNILRFPCGNGWLLNRFGKGGKLVPFGKAGKGGKPAPFGKAGKGNRLGMVELSTDRFCGDPCPVG